MKDYLKIFSVLMGSFILLFILIPLIITITSENPYAILETLNDSEVLNSIFISGYCAFLTTLIAMIFGVPLAYLLARYDFPFKGFAEALIDIPIVIPHTVSGIALLTVFSNQGIIGMHLNKIGITFTDSIAGITIAMLFVSSSFMVNSVREGFEAVDPRFEKVARTLGAGSFKTFFMVTLPLTYRNIAVGSIMTWARAISEFGAVIVMAYYPRIAPTLIYERFVNFGLSASRPIAILLIIICIIAFIIIRFLIKGRKIYHDKT